MIRKSTVIKTILACILLFAFQITYAQEASVVTDAPREAGEQMEPASRGATEMPLSYAQAAEADEMLVADSSTVRQFHEVIDELLAEFGYDVKMGQIKGLKNVSIRDVEVSEAIPKTYENYIELLVAERIRENSKVRLISCVACKTRTSRLIEGKLMITSPRTNMDNMTRIADQLGIEYFMDVVMVYHATHMVMAFQVFNTSTKEMVWARAYNSETVKSRYQKLAVDYSQVEKSRAGEDYVPEYRTLVGFGGASIPNVGGSKNDSSMLTLQVRGTEKFNNRRDEFGLFFAAYKTTNSFIKPYPTEGSSANEGFESEETATTSDEIVPVPYDTAITLQGVYAHNFLGSLESYNTMRYGVSASGGFFLAKGYLAPVIRGGADVYYGRRFMTNVGLVYIAASKILIEDEYVDTTGGLGVEVILAFNF